MNKKELQEKYPDITVRSDPSPTCRICKGVGEYKNKRMEMHVCLCACLTPWEGKDDIRDLAAEVLHKKMWRQ